MVCRDFQCRKFSQAETRSTLWWSLACARQEIRRRCGSLVLIRLSLKLGRSPGGGGKGFLLPSEVQEAADEAFSLRGAVRPD